MPPWRGWKIMGHLKIAATLWPDLQVTFMEAVLKRKSYGTGTMTISRKKTVQIADIFET